MTRHSEDVFSMTHSGWNGFPNDPLRAGVGFQAGAA